jgi:hypothetical protein
LLRRKLESIFINLDNIGVGRKRGGSIKLAEGVSLHSASRNAIAANNLYDGVFYKLATSVDYYAGHKIWEFGGGGESNVFGSS